MGVIRNDRVDIWMVQDVSPPDGQVDGYSCTADVDPKRLGEGGVKGVDQQKNSSSSMYGGTVTTSSMYISEYVYIIFAIFVPELCDIYIPQYFVSTRLRHWLVHEPPAKASFFIAMTQDPFAIAGVGYDRWGSPTILG